jgi:endonuclease III
MENQERISAQLLAFDKTIDPISLFPTLVDEASAFVLTNPYAFALAVCLDRGTKADIIWTIPYWIFWQIKHLDPYEIDLLSLEDIAGIIDHLPKKPRYRTDAPRTIQELTRLVINEFDGEASRIWEGRSAGAVKRTFQSIFGVGPGIANMSVLLIEKAFGIRFDDLDRRFMDIKPDVHTMRVLYRLGAAEEISESAAIMAARKLNPDFPGEIDAPLWILGRECCSAHNPICSKCPLNGVCPKVGI